MIVFQFFDPCGIFEPIKLMIKLQTAGLKGKGWDQILLDSLDKDQRVWKDILKDYFNLPEINVTISISASPMVSFSASTFNTFANYLEVINTNSQFRQHICLRVFK